ncbi:MscS Mechanosensitive ion channel:Conserved TM helix [Georgfuchsia toluolica]|uniref:Small-conductance mechanosensitive channel n=1 Tax=Georgfuchsia toluolica TaxID=424218 RepID=A0A916J624_9PROT|nr:mechanosensitive ion channel domain-containing protein [Georgfuchsia toluolica]CAG4884612.1 MscS Mechanosensitive ion channel:Conserved TM helix [Georgfuchsia toluolica]
MDSSLQSLDQVKASALDMTVRFGPKLLVAIIILVAGYLVGRWAGRILERLLVRLKLEAQVRSLLVRIAQILILGLFAIMALQNLGIELLPLIAGLGVAGAGIALAMQGILGNVAAGLTIIFTRPFHVGDYISIAKEEGEVLDISLFSTTLGHTDQSKVVIPNRKIVGEILHNYGQIRQLDIAVGVAYGTDVNVALSVIKEILHANPRVLRDPTPVFGVARLAESSVTISVAPWVNVPDYVAAVSEVNKTILETFSAQNIVIALPQCEVRMLDGSARVS